MKYLHLAKVSQWAQMTDGIESQDIALCLGTVLIRQPRTVPATLWGHSKHWLNDSGDS